MMCALASPPFNKDAWGSASVKVLFAQQDNNFIAATPWAL